jgi:chromosome segregation ATPase
MNDNLQQTKKKLEDVTRRYEKLGQEIQELNSLVVSKRTELAKAIAQEKDPGGLGDEIVRLQTRLKGAQGAHEMLTTELRELQKKKAVEERAVQLEKAETAGREALNAAGDIYLMLADLIDKLPDLRTKARAFRAALRPNHPTALNYRSQRIDRVCEAVEQGFPGILEHFPNEIFVDENLPSPAELKKRLRRVMADMKNLSNGDLHPPQNLRR